MSYYDIITEGVSIPLTSLASGYTPQGLIGLKVFPVVKPLTRSGKAPIFSKDAFKIYNTYRATGARSNRAQIDPETWVDFYMEEHDLCIPIDVTELEAIRALAVDARSKALFDLQNRQRRRVQWNLALRLEAEIADQVQTAGNFGANTVTIGAGSQWGSSGGSPITVIETAREAIRDTIGLYPNTMVMGASAYETLKFHSAYTALMRLANEKVVRPDLLARTHDLKEVMIGLAMQVDFDGNFVDLWGDNVLLFYKPDTTTPAIDEPSFGYTLRPKYGSKPYPYVDVFSEEGGKIFNVRCTDMYDTIFTMATAGYLIRDVKA